MTHTSYRINWLGAWTLYKKEVHRFMKVCNQTLFAPVVTSMLFLAIFNLAMGRHIATIGGVPFALFMGSGLIIMAVVQNAFANSSSTLIMSKMMGTIIDYLMVPLSAGEIIFALVMAAVTRGAIVGLLVAIAIALFLPVSLASPGYALFYIIAASMLLALLGIFAGIVSESFDQMAAVTSYVITPLSFLSGTFYSVKNLPALLYHISHFNPFFYMIDGFRYGITGYHDGSLAAGLWVMILTIIGMWMLVYTMMKRGYRLKS